MAGQPEDAHGVMSALHPIPCEFLPKETGKGDGVQHSFSKSGRKVRGATPSIVLITTAIIRPSSWFRAIATITIIPLL